jgi:hypothetical protein
MNQTATRKKPKTIEILVNNSSVEIHDRDETGAEIKEAAGLPLDFTLYDPKGAAIDNEQSIRVRRHERFIAISGQDVS